jgi:Na+/melibiose symporter-like transporter
MHSSALQRSGQTWKLWIISVGVLIGFVIIVFAKLFRNDLPERLFPIEMIFAAFVIAVTFFFTVLSVRCPPCRVRWYWLAIGKDESTTWLDRITLSTCPICGYPGKDLRGSRGEGTIEY